MILFPKAGVLVLAISSVAYCDLVTKGWTLAAANIAPDGFTRSAALVNGQFPGPLLTANKGDTIIVNVQNNLADPTMRRSTSIVCLLKQFSPLYMFLLIMFQCSTGTVS